MNRSIWLMPLILFSACSQEPTLEDVTQNNMQEAERPTPPDPVATTSAESTSDGAIAEIPKAFHGNWSANVADCGKGSDVTRLTIAPTELRFYESTADIIGVVASGPEIRVTARYAGEGETWDQTRVFTLSADGDVLTSEGMTRARCR
ncbi:hypothetical protein [Sphingomonas sp.]|uniref:hypothetical protein n=1 Tax=Sphingomonas sp. TaxID=28214 RepID=UPI000BC861C9|nr:hypothetical protein [Sphingomonas sp.]MBA4763824.1 hypothetical protein [Sphingomonas sp.]OYX50675.1 MAG: hypothetical protein B7Y97_06850 [Sphingomonas sp. 32-66-10]